MSDQGVRSAAGSPFQPNGSDLSGLVKICGLREPVHATAAAVAGADLLGFIFAPARRQVTAQQAAACVEAARAAAAGRRILTVGVFVNASPEEMNTVAELADLNLLQLHGDEDPELPSHLVRPVIRALRPQPGTPTMEVTGLIERHARASRSPMAFLLEGYAAGSHGGTGARADWGLAAELARRRPLLLAGGLDPENVGDAIAIAAPHGVDVSSGVETDGFKDIGKIEAFVAAARQAFAGRG